MFLQGQKKKIDKYVIYSRWGVQTHLIMNEHGVSYTCNPLLKNNKCQVFDSLYDATIARENNTFYDRIAEIQLIMSIKIELNID